MPKAIAAALEAARRCADADYAVVPLHPRDKRPRVKNWTECASTDPAQLERWFTKWPDSNLGLMPPEGCIVIDVDPRNGGNADLLRLPKNTPTQRTGGGGWHFVVRVEPGVELPALSGVDYIHPGRQQFCAWPSVHPNGKRYEWVKGLEPWTVEPARWRPCKTASHGPAPAQAPAGDSQPGGLAPIPTSKAPSYTLTRLRDLGLTVHRLDPDRWGAGKHDAWVREWVAPVHHETRGSAEGLALAHEVSALFGHYDPDALDAKWPTFGQKPRDKLRTGATLEAVVRKLQGGSNAQRAPSRALPLEQLAGFASAARPPDWLVRHVLPKGVMAALLGVTHAGKSAVAVSLAVSVGAAAPTWCGQAVRARGAVLYIVAEGVDGMRARARIYAEKVIGLSPDEMGAAPIFFLTVAVSLSVEEEVECVAADALRYLREWASCRGVEPIPVVLVVVDTLARNIGGDADESSNSDMARVVNNCALLQDRLAVLDAQGERPAVLLVAHPGHADTSRIRGAYAVQAAADVILRLEVPPGNVELTQAEKDAQDLVGVPVPVGQPRKLVVVKSRDSAAPPPLLLQLVQDKPAWLRDPDTREENTTVFLAAHSDFGPVLPAPRRGKPVADVLRVVRDYGATESVRAMAARLGLSTHSTLSERLRSMEGEGLVRKKDGHYVLTAKGSARCE